VQADSDVRFKFVFGIILVEFLSSYPTTKVIPQPEYNFYH
jgi:hypothetical protein